MRKNAVWGLTLLVLALAGPVWAQGHVEGPEYDKVKHLIERFESPGRAEWQKPSVILRVLGIDEGSRVADIGAGTGYLMPFLSTLVGAAGHVWAVDIDEDLLAYLDVRFPGDNVETVLADTDDPKLPDGEVEVVILVNTWHHIAKRGAYIDRLEQALVEGGRVAIVDFYNRELPVGPPPGHKLEMKKVLKEFGKADWELVAQSTALPYQYFLVFSPKTEPRPLADATAYPPGTEGQRE